MLTIATPFTDCHGIQYTAPVVQISHANYSGNSNIQVAANGDTHVERHSNVTHNLSYQAFIWINAAAKAAGLKPLFLKDKNGNDWHSVVIANPVWDTAAIVELCEQHIQSTIIPQLTPATTQE